MTKLTLAQASALLSRALDASIVTRGGGGWLSFGGQKLSQGEDKSVKHLVDNPEIAAAIAAKLTPAGGDASASAVDLGDRKPHSKVDAFVVTAKRDQPRRRIGRLFHRSEETVIPVGDLTEEEISALRADPDLNVILAPAKPD